MYIDFYPQLFPILYPSSENLLPYLSIKYVKKLNQITNHYYEYKIAMVVGAVFAS